KEEGGIRDDLVTGVQTCALPISAGRVRAGGRRLGARRAAGARGRLRAVDDRHALPDGRSRLGAAVGARRRADAGGVGDAGGVVQIGRASRRGTVWAVVVGTSASQ